MLRLALRHVRSGLAILSEPRKPTGPWLREGYAVHPHHRYYDPIRPTHRLPFISRCSPFIERVLACQPSASGSLLWIDAPSTRAVTRTPRGGLGARARFFPKPSGLPRQWSGSAPLVVRHWFLPGNVTTLQCSLHATARVVACPPAPARPEAALRPSRAFTSELPRGLVTHAASRV